MNLFPIREEVAKVSLPFAHSGGLSSRFGFRVSQRSSAVLGLLVVLGLLELDLWYLRALETDTPRGIVYGLIAFVMWLTRRTRGGKAAAGKSTRSLLRAWSETFGGSTVAGLALLATSWLMGGTGSFPQRTADEFLSWIGCKTAAVAAQQIGLQLFLLPTLYQLTGRKWTALLASAIIFGLLHLPNVLLVALTILAGGLWCWLYQRMGRLLPLIVSHVLLATLAHAAFDEHLIYDLRVGAKLLPRLEREARLRSEGKLETVRALSSEAYFAKHGQDQRAFVTALYGDVLQRRPEPAELDYWTAKLRYHSRADVVIRFLTGTEFAAKPR